MALQIPIISEFDGKGIKKAVAEFKQLEGAGKKTAFALKKAMVPATAALGALAAAGLKAVDAASDLQEAQSKVNVIFGEGAADIIAYSKTASKAIGQSQQSVLDAAGTFGTFGKAAGLSGKDLAKFSNDFTALASDIASFSNATPEEVITALGAGLRGESEPLRRFGVLLSAEAIEMEAVNMGLVKFSKNAIAVKRATIAVERAQQKYTVAVSKFGPDSLQARAAMAAYEAQQERLSKAMAGKMDKLTQEQKILAATSLIYKQTSDAQGDFQRTSTGLANQQRILTAEYANLTSQLGTALLPVFQQLMPYLTRFADWASKNPGIVKGIAAAIGILAASVIAMNIAMMANPIGLIIAGSIALGVAIVALYNKFEGFRNVVRVVFNGIMGYFEFLYNNFIRIVNAMIRAFNIVKPGKDIPTLGHFNLPRLGDEDGGSSSGTGIRMMATGGLVTSPTLAMIGEAGPEAVIPLDRMGEFGGGGSVTINVNGGNPQAVVDALVRWYRQNGPVPVKVA